MTLLPITLLWSTIFFFFHMSCARLRTLQYTPDIIYHLCLFRVREGHQSRSHSRLHHDWYPAMEAPVVNVKPVVMWICESVNEIWVLHQRGRLTANISVITFIFVGVFKVWQTQSHVWSFKPLFQHWWNPHVCLLWKESLQNTHTHIIRHSPCLPLVIKQTVKWWNLQVLSFSQQWRLLCSISSTGPKAEKGSLTAATDGSSGSGTPTWNLYAF